MTQDTLEGISQDVTCESRCTEHASNCPYRFQIPKALVTYGTGPYAVCPQKELGSED